MCVCMVVGGGTYCQRGLEVSSLTVRDDRVLITELKKGVYVASPRYGCNPNSPQNVYVASPWYSNLNFPQNVF